MNNRNPVILFLAATLLLGLGGQSAFAHARLLRADPADRAELKRPPARVELWFNELLDDGFNVIEVYPVKELNAASHRHLTKGGPAVDPKDPTHLTILLEPLQPGDYIVDYRVLSRDGHTAPGRITFQVSAGK